MSNDIREYIRSLRREARFSKRAFARNMRERILSLLKIQIESLLNARRKGWQFDTRMYYASAVSASYLIADACGVISEPQYRSLQKFCYGKTLTEVLAERAQKASAA